MILIWGIRARARALATGEFFCTACGTDRTYVLHQFRRWFTFFFIPLFPVGKPFGQQISCTTCGTRFGVEALDMPTSAEFSTNLGSATRVAAISMLVAGDRYNTLARSIAMEASRRAGIAEYDETWLENDLEALDPSELGGYLAPLAKGMDPHGKETFIAQIARVALADGQVTPAEQQVLESLGSALGITATHLRGIIVTTAAPDEHRPN